MSYESFYYYSASFVFSCCFLYTTQLEVSKTTIESTLPQHFFEKIEHCITLELKKENISVPNRTDFFQLIHYAISTNKNNSNNNDNNNNGSKNNMIVTESTIDKKSSTTPKDNGNNHKSWHSTKKSGHKKGNAGKNNRKSLDKYYKDLSEDRGYTEDVEDSEDIGEEEQTEATLIIASDKDRGRRNVRVRGREMRERQRGERKAEMQWVRFYSNPLPQI